MFLMYQSSIRFLNCTGISRGDNDRMICISCRDISFSYGIDKILENISFSIQDNDKVGLVGVNGAGKTTLFNILCRRIEPDTGDINILKKSCSIGYLKQNMTVDSSKTLWEEVSESFHHLIEMEKELKVLETEMGVMDHRVESYTQHLNKYSELSEKFAQLGGYEYNSYIRGILRGLGFNETQFYLSASALSGGQKTRLALAKLLVGQPDILMLDEPTNHLDIEAISWLEDFLSNYKKCVFIISHDRYFLDKVTKKTIELEHQQCTVAECSYSEFMLRKKQNREIQQKHYENQQKQIKKMEAFIKQQKQWNRQKNIIAAESRQKAIDRMEKINAPKKAPDKIRIKFRSEIISGNDVLFVEGLSKEFPGRKLFSDLSFHLTKNERLFLLGPNGCGKSTLLKILAGVLPQTEGSFEYGHKISVGYYDQELSQLEEDNTILDEVWNENGEQSEVIIRNTLAVFNFSEDDVMKRISVLSGGEKSRVMLCKLVLSGHNLLILDEPTNHLDIYSREVLEQAINDFDGTVICVSHDRYFVNKLATRIIEMGNIPIIDVSGDYEFFLKYKRRQAEVSESISTGNALNSEAKAVSEGKMNYEEQKLVQAQKRKLEKELNNTENRITEVEERITAIDEEMVSEGIVTDHVRLSELSIERNQLESELEELYEKWEMLGNMEA